MLTVKNVAEHLGVEPRTIAGINEEQHADIYCQEILDNGDPVLHPYTAYLVTFNDGSEAWVSRFDDGTILFPWTPTQIQAAKNVGWERAWGVTL